jgi:hypothetical protein
MGLAVDDAKGEQPAKSPKRDAIRKGLLYIKIYVQSRATFCVA